MKLSSIVKRELFERKHQLFTSFFGIALGIAAIVSINNITHYSEKAIGEELSKLGTNVLIMPKGSTVENYYTADMGDDYLPEDYVAMLSASGIHGMENLSPKLSEKVNISGKEFILTGILPKNEIKSKALWQGGLQLSNCAKPDEIPLNLEGKSREAALVENRLIKELGSDEVFVGQEAASNLGIKKGDNITINNQSFSVSVVLPVTGSVDDSRIFAHLHTVQKMYKKEKLISVIEVVGCCNEIFDGLVGNINRLLPNAKVITFGQVVQTQRKTNVMMAKLSWAFLVLIVMVGGASIANDMYGNVHERQQEIGVLMALGADSGIVFKLFLLKATILGVAGGIAGYVIGTILAMGLGPEIAGINVAPMPSLLPTAIGISLCVATIATWLPARKATKVDPCIAFRDV